MAKQIVLHYAGSYVERPHTITFDSEREYLKFIQEKGYQLKPNVEYGVFTLNAILRTQFQQSSIEIEDVSEADKPDISTVTPPTIDIKYPQCDCTSDKEDNKGSDNNININITIPGLENITTNQGNVNINQGNNQDGNQAGNDTPPKDEEGGNPTPPAVTPPADDQEDVVVIGGDEGTQNPTEDTDTTDTETGTTDNTTDNTQNTDQEEVTGNDGQESQDSGESEIIIPDEGSNESTTPTPGDEDIIVL
ncbi:hypothetical protein [Campylobacter vicugnae]|uniref:hypothetical protein n=1 Tax=Campylobacter vicugnae TaxID=1660076 RepID=UPI000A359D37|nr:hypothetical protein [Campylobacter sp. RM9262]